MKKQPIGREQEGRPVSFWHFKADGRIQCDLCPRYCRLKDGQRGMCFVRARRGERLVLLTDGRSSGFCVDPIEKKPLNHFLPGSATLSFGTAGCNLACKFCQNWHISKSREMDTLAETAPAALIAQVARRLGCRSVAFTYNDPVIFMEYAIEVARQCHRLGLRTVAVTAGYICEEPRREFFRYIDAANVDLKGFTEDFYWKLTKSHLQPVLDTLVYLRRDTEVWIEITTLLIPGYNDSDKEIDQLTGWIEAELGAATPIHFTAFHPNWKMTATAPTPSRTLKRARAIALANGLKYAYTGNIYDCEGQSTYCSGCGALLIERQGYHLGDWNLTEQGNCRLCGATCAGFFEKEPGNWGARYLPVSLVATQQSS